MSGEMTQNGQEYAATKVAGSVTDQSSFVPTSEAERTVARAAAFLDSRDGFCACGCGERTKIATRSDSTTNRVAGRPMKFVRGHNARRDHFAPERYTVADRGYETDCWLWNGAKFNTGYGKFRVDGREVLVHRAYHEFFNGPIPEGFQVDHLCVVRECCNPAHLEAVTQAENIRRGFASRKAAMEAAA